MLRGEYDVIQSVIEWLIAYTQNPCPGPRNDSRAHSFLCVDRTNITHASLIPVARPIAHAQRRLAAQDLDSCPSPPCWPSPHFCGHILKVFGVLRSEHNIIQGVIEQLIASTQKPCPGPHNNPRAHSFLCIYCKHITRTSLISVARPAACVRRPIPCSAKELHRKSCFAATSQPGVRAILNLFTFGILKRMTLPVSTP